MTIRGMKLSDTLLILLLTLSCRLDAAPVRLTGTGPGFGGAELKVFILNDPVTKAEMPVMRLRCSENGSFSFGIDINSVSTVIIKSGIFRFWLTVMPGTDYSLSLPEYIPRPVGEEDNPFYSEAVYIPEVTNREDDINNLMKEFDREFNPVFNAVAHRVFNNFRREELPLFIERLNRVSDSHGNPFFADFIRYRMIMLNLVARGEYSGRVEDSVIINSKFNFENPAYIDLVDQLFTGYFRILASGEMSQSYYGALKQSSLDALREVIHSDGKISDPQLTDYVITLNLFPEYFAGAIPREIILEIITDVTIRGTSEYIRSVALAAIRRLEIYTRGRNLPEISLKQTDGSEKVMSALRGEPALLCFISGNEQLVQTELTLMQLWIGKYISNVRVIFILKERESEWITKKMESTLPDARYFYLVNPDMAEYLYDIRMYPSFMLIDSEGKIFINPAPMPSENLEQAVASLVQKG